MATHFIRNLYKLYVKIIFTVFYTAIQNNYDSQLKSSYSSQHVFRIHTIVPQ